MVRVWANAWKPAFIRRHTQYGMARLDCIRLMQELVGWSSYKALESALADGRARAIGISNFNASAIDALLSGTSVKPAFNQCGFSVGNHASKESPAGKDDVTRGRCVCVSVCLRLSVSLSCCCSVFKCNFRGQVPRLEYNVWCILPAQSRESDEGPCGTHATHTHTHTHVIASLRHCMVALLIIALFALDTIGAANCEGSQREFGGSGVAVGLTLSKRLFGLPLICCIHSIRDAGACHSSFAVIR